jgi:hypothetical protein
MGARSTLVRFSSMVSVAALALLTVPAVGSAADPPTCDSLGYAVAYLRIDGSIYAGSTRYIKLRLTRKNPTDGKAQSDPEYPFPLTVAPSNGASRTFTVRSFPKDEFPVTFSKGETDVVTAKYVEVHTSYGLLGVMSTRCTRELSATFRKPPRPRARPRRGSRRGPHRGRGRGRDDDQDQGQHERERDARR